MKEQIERFKKENGNNTYTQRELMMYLVSRVDDIHDKMGKDHTQIMVNKQGLSQIWKVIGLVGTGMVGFFGWILTRIFE